jgi:hypothetical protein
MVRTTLAAIAGAMLLGACAPAAPAPPDVHISERAYETAQLAGDAAALEQLIADDYVLTGSDGARQNKAELIAFWTADGFDPQASPLTNQVQFIWSESAVFGGTTTLSWTQNGAPISVTIRYVDVWALRDGRWQVVYGQSTRVP